MEPKEAEPGFVEQGVIDVCTNNAVADARPDILAQARLLAQYLDDPKMEKDHSSISRQLGNLMEKLCPTVTKVSRGRLVTMQHLRENKMFERMNDRSRRVIVLAQEETRTFNHKYIGTEHILLGLIHEGGGVAAKALESLSISLEDVRSQVEEIIGRGPGSPSGHIPFTPRAKKVLELSLREALQLGHNYIGTEHILLGLIREGEGVAAQVLVKLGAELTRVRQQVIQLLSGYQGKKPAEAILVNEIREHHDWKSRSISGIVDPDATYTIVVDPNIPALKITMTVPVTAKLLIGLMGWRDD